MTFIGKLASKYWCRSVIGNLTIKTT